MRPKYLNVVPLLLFAALLLMSPAASQAQAAFGIRAGLNATNISFDLLPNRSERIGFHAGFFADLPVVADFISVQPEVSYSVKGAAFKPLDDRRNLNMDYIDLLLPVAFKLGPVDVQLGPFVSYLISTPEYEVFNENSVIVDAFKKADAGLTGGLSYNFSKLFIGVRYNQGFIDVTKDNSRPFLGSGKNSVGQVSLGFRF